MRFFILLASIFFIWSCGSEKLPDTEEACRLEFVDSVEQGDFETAQELIDDPQCNFSKEEKIINKTLILDKQAGVDYIKYIDEITDIWFADYKFRELLIRFSPDSSGEGIKKLSLSIDTFSSLSDKEIYQYCIENRKTLTDIERDICFNAGITHMARAIYLFSMALAGNGGSDAKQVSSRFLLQIKRDTFCSDDRNKNGVIDEADALYCAFKFAKNEDCNLDNVLLSSKPVSFSKGSKTYNFALLKIKVKTDEEQCPLYNDKIIYKLLYKPNRFIALTEGYCSTNFEPCNEPDGENCLPCPVIEPKDILNNLRASLNRQNRLIWFSFPDPYSVNIAKFSRGVLEEICKFNMDKCQCGKNVCNEETINLDNLLITVTNDAIIEYLLSHYVPEEED